MGSNSEKQLKGERNPFPGLRPFRPDEKEFFYGRENESRDIAEKIIANRFVAIIGAPGTGKTSLINCGVIPALTGMPESKKSGWKIISFTPGTDPAGNLAGAIATTAAEGEDAVNLRISIADVLKSNRNSLAVFIKDLVIKGNEKVLIVVDQFEEIFRYRQRGRGSEPTDDIAAFLDILLNAVEQPVPEIYLIISLSSDYISECTKFYRFTQSIIINRSSVVIPALSEATLKDVVIKPLQRAGVAVESILTETIAGEAVAGGIPLPVVQHALMRAWNRRQNLYEGEKPLTLADYTSGGGLEKALGNHAEELYASLDENVKKACEKLFRIITARSAGNGNIRKPASFSLIKSISGMAAEDLKSVIDIFSFGDSGFIKVSGDLSADDNAVVDLSYDCIPGFWKRLKKWIDEEAASADIYIRLSELSALWQQGRGGLLKPPELYQYLAWRDRQQPSIQWAIRYNPAFERAMVYLRTSENELKAEEKAEALKRKKRARWRRFFAFAMGIAFISAIAISLFAFSKKIAREKELRIAETEKQRADSISQALLYQKIASDSAVSAAMKREMEVVAGASEAQKSINMLRAKAESSKNEAIRARQNEELARSEKKETERLRMVSTAKSMSLRSLQIQGKKDLQTLLAYQAFLFNKRYNGTPYDPDIYMGLYNVAKQYGNPVYRVFRGHAGGIKSIAFLPNSREFFTSGTDGRIIRWNPANKNQELRVVYSGPGVAEVLSVSPDAAWLACGMNDSRIKMIPLKGEEGMQYELNGHTGKLKSLIFSYDAKYLYSSAAGGKLLKWDLSAKTSVNIETGKAEVNAIDISHDGKYLAGVTSGGSAVVWNTGEGSDALKIGGQGRSIRIIRFKPLENSLAVGYDDGLIEFWNVEAGFKTLEMQAHESAVNDICFNKVSAQMATAGDDGSLKLWNMGDLKTFPVEFSDNDGPVITIAFSPDGQMLISGTAGGADNLVGRPALADLMAVNICSSLTRNFSENEWVNYVGNDIPYEKTCQVNEFSIKVNILGQ